MTVSKINFGVDINDLNLIKDCIAEDIWMQFKNKSFFITGGTGFIGCWLLEALLYANEVLNLNITISVLTRNSDAFKKKAPHLALADSVFLIEGDVTDLASLSGHYDVMIHAATDVVKPNSDPQVIFNDIKLGAEQVLALAKRSGTTRFLLTSSGAVYGRQPLNMMYISEEYYGSSDLSQSKSAYGLGKRYSEWLVNLAHEQIGLDTKIARCFAFVGPYMALDAQFAIANFIGDCIEGRDVVIGGDGTPFRSYLYAADLIIWLLTILIKGDNSPYNVGSSNSIQIAPLAHKVREVLASDNAIVVKQLSNGSLPERYVPSVARVKLLNLSEYTDIDNAILKTAQWNLRRLEK